jgi:hypothetical protein
VPPPILPSSFFFFSSQGAEKKNGDGFAKLDMAGPWANVRIPVVMMLRDDADTLLSLFELKKRKEITAVAFIHTAAAVMSLLRRAY